MRKMDRRVFSKASLVMLGSSLLRNESASGAAAQGEGFPGVKVVTEYIGRFVVETRFGSIPKDVVELGKKSIQDGFGLALAGSRAETGVICRKYLQALGISGAKSVVIG